MTFDELTKGCTSAEIEAMARHLADFRAHRTYEALRPAAPEAPTGAIVEAAREAVRTFEAWDTSPTYDDADHLLPAMVEAMQALRAALSRDGGSHD